MSRRSIVAFVIAALLGLLLPSVAAAEEPPSFWAGPNNGMSVYAMPHGQLTVPYVVAHAAQAEVSCTLLIYTMRGPTQVDLASVPMGTVRAVPADFCNADSGGALPFSFTWDDVTLDAGSYRCKVQAFDGASWATSDLWCPVQIMSTADTTPPLTTTDYDGLWRRSTLQVAFDVADDPGGWGADGGSAHVDFSVDGGLTWARSWYARFAIWRRGGGSGVFTLLYRGTDAAGNEERVTHSTQVCMDARAPVTTDDAPLDPQQGDVVVHLTAADSMFGVTQCSGVAATWYSLDGGRWNSGASVTVPSRVPGLHWIAYYSTDVAGNAENVKYCPVIVVPPGAPSTSRSQRWGQ